MNHTVIAHKYKVGDEVLHQITSENYIVTAVSASLYPGTSMPVLSYYCSDGSRTMQFAEVELTDYEEVREDLKKMNELNEASEVNEIEPNVTERKEN